MQGQLRRSSLRIKVQTECAHCGEVLELEIDDQLQMNVIQPKARPVVFAPMVDLYRLEAPTIIDDF